VTQDGSGSLYVVDKDEGTVLRALYHAGLGKDLTILGGEHRGPRLACVGPGPALSPRMSERVDPHGRPTLYLGQEEDVAVRGPDGEDIGHRPLRQGRDGEA
jgi:hypothetical protein